MEADVFEHARFLQRGRHQRLRRGAAVLGIKFLVERASVHADAQGDARVRGRLADRGTDLVEFADVARIHAHGGATGIDGLEYVLALEVDVGDHRNRRFFDDFRQRVGIILAWHGHAHDVAPGGGQFRDLTQGSRHIRGHRVGHGLHRNRRSTADRHRSDHDAAGFAAGMQRAFADVRVTGFAERFFVFWHT